MKRGRAGDSLEDLERRCREGLNDSDDGSEKSEQGDTKEQIASRNIVKVKRSNTGAGE
jgi:hypothetical protein